MFSTCFLKTRPEPEPHLKLLRRGCQPMSSILTLRDLPRPKASPCWTRSPTFRQWPQTCLWSGIASLERLTSLPSMLPPMSMSSTLAMDGIRIRHKACWTCLPSGTTKVIFRTFGSPSWATSCILGWRAPTSTRLRHWVARKYGWWAPKPWFRQILHRWACGFFIPWKTAFAIVMLSSCCACKANA